MSPSWESLLNSSAARLSSSGTKREPAEEKSGAAILGVGESSDHEIHIWTERERRKKMRNMFANLHALLPHLPPKADKSTIVDEAVNYIKGLQQTLQKLQKQKLERIHNTNVAPYAYDSLKLLPSQSSTREAFLADHASSSNDMSALLFSNSTTTSPNIIPARSCSVFQTWTSSNVVLNVCGGDAQISICSAKKPGLFTAICYVLKKHKINVVSAHVSADIDRSLFMIQAHANGGCNEFGTAIVAEDIFKQAAGEIIFWLSS
ncbi:transcription factor bHLH95-like [Momordica charantia]|uniref:Transcription factor bHLH95-like n=1 Tax=Momordica charantia TaxID=3673 RepID=A0A6J1C3B3_MOMCH|nr:transcription factor bHLH95-like [Momordica charantia]